MPELIVMKALGSVILFLLIVSLPDMFGQTGDSYRKVRVEDLLTEAEDHYQVRFSYSKEIVPYDDVVAVQSSTSSLIELLQVLEEQTQIIYQKRGSRVILNVDVFEPNPEAVAVQVSVTTVQMGLPRSQISRQKLPPASSTHVVPAAQSR